MIRTAYTLYRHIKSCLTLSFCHINGFQMIQKCFSCIPWHIFGFDSHIVTLSCTDRNDHNILESETFRKLVNIFHNFIKSLFTVSHKIHFVHCEYKVMNSHQRADTAMASCLYQNPLFCIDQNDCKLCKRSTDSHISCIFFVTRCVCNDKTSFICSKITIRHVDGDTLFSFCHQTVKKK